MKCFLYSRYFRFVKRLGARKVLQGEIIAPSAHFLFVAANLLNSRVAASVSNFATSTFRCRYTLAAVRTRLAIMINRCHCQFDVCISANAPAKHHLKGATELGAEMGIKQKINRTIKHYKEIENVARNA